MPGALGGALGGQVGGQNDAQMLQERQGSGPEHHKSDEVTQLVLVGTHLRLPKGAWGNLTILRRGYGEGPGAPGTGLLVLRSLQGSQTPKTITGSNTPWAEGPANSIFTFHIGTLDIS